MVTWGSGRHSRILIQKKKRERPLYYGDRRPAGAEPQILIERGLCGPLDSGRHVERVAVLKRYRLACCIVVVTAIRSPSQKSRTMPYLAKTKCYGGVIPDGEHISIGQTPQNMHCFGVGGKTLCEVLTVADAMSLSMAGSRVDCNLSRHGSVRPPLQRGGSRIWNQLPRLGSRAAPMRAGSSPNAAPSATCRHFTVVRQIPNLTPQRPN